MMIIPSIDLMNGKVVRLIQGKTCCMKIYNFNPIKLAEEFLEKGVDLIHVVDLDAALERGNNRNIILDMVSRGFPLQVGGGIRNIKTAISLLDEGVKRIILGTIVLKNPIMFQKILRSVDNDRIGVSIDYKGSKVLIRGWKESTPISPIELALNLQNLGVKWFIFTSVEKDGTLTGVDVKTLKIIRNKIKAKMIAAGGISSISDILNLKKIGLDGVILGKALHDKLLKLEDIMEVVKNAIS